MQAVRKSDVLVMQQRTAINVIQAILITIAPNFGVDGIVLKPEIFDAPALTVPHNIAAQVRVGDQKRALGLDRNFRQRFVALDTPDCVGIGIDRIDFVVFSDQKVINFMAHRFLIP